MIYIYFLLKIYFKIWTYELFGWLYIIVACSLINTNKGPYFQFSQGKRERLYKVLVVGELGSGKTSIIKRYVHQFFSQHYRATIGQWNPKLSTVAHEINVEILILKGLTLPWKCCGGMEIQWCDYKWVWCSKMLILILTYFDIFWIILMKI